MKLKIAICDDNFSDCQHIQELLEHYQMKYDFEFQISVFTEPEKLLACYHTPATFDLLFLDVEMPEITGLAIAQRIRELPDYDVRIIFISNYPEYMQDSFNVSAFQYLQKPVDETLLHNQFKRLLREFSSQSAYSILVRQEDHEEHIFTRQLLYIETLKHQKNTLRYVCKNECIIGKGLLSDIEQDLNSQCFFSPHRGFLINIQQVHFIRQNEIEMMNGDLIPLSRRREKEFRSFFNKSLL